VKQIAIALTLLAAFAATTVPAFAQSTNPINYQGVVQAGWTVRFNPITFNANQSAVVTMTGDGSTDLDLYVYDEYGTEVARDENATDKATVRFVPRRTGMYFIKVINRGKVWNVFNLVTN
jgi:hypothetical protein